jgi:phosphatidylglycerol:prolipoprotein diacylglycerol transferase
MASHGGMIGVVVACWLIARAASRNAEPLPASGSSAPPRVPTLHIMDLTAFVATPGLLLGRLANFINGELLGKIVAPPGQPAPWWAVRFPQERLDWYSRTGPLDQPRGHAPALTEDQSIALDAITQRFRLPSDNDYTAFTRVLHELQHASSATAKGLAADLAPLIAARHPSQLYQAFAEGIVLTIALWLIWRAPRTPGMIASAFLIIYGVLRIITELYRLPDSHLALERIAGLTRGQWLSVVMIVAGIALAAAAVKWRTRHNLSPMGGIWVGRLSEPTRLG